MSQPMRMQLEEILQELDTNQHSYELLYSADIQRLHKCLLPQLIQTLKWVEVEQKKAFQTVTETFGGKLPLHLALADKLGDVQPFFDVAATVGRSEILTELLAKLHGNNIGRIYPEKSENEDQSNRTNKQEPFSWAKFIRMGWRKISPTV